MKHRLLHAIETDSPVVLCLQVMSKGRIVQHGRVPVAVKAGSGKKKRFDYDDSGIVKTVATFLNQ